MNRLLFILLLLFSCSVVYGQPNYLFIKKGFKKKRTYAEGDRILLQVKNGTIYSGLITHLINNTIYINGRPVEKDSVKAVLLPGRNNKFHIDLKDFLLINAGVALTSVGLSLNKQATVREAVTAGFAIGYTPIVFAWLKSKIHLRRKKFKMGKRFRLQVFDLYVPEEGHFNLLHPNEQDKYKLATNYTNATNNTKSNTAKIRSIYVIGVLNLYNIAATMKAKSFFQKLWRWTKKIFLVLFIAHFVYIILLKWVNPPVTITQLVSWITGHGLKRDYVSTRSISPYAKLAVMSSEDQLFPDHNGFDWKSIKKAMEYNKKKPGRTRGASTISQQVAKNVFLWQGGGYIRKGFEVYFTFMIELIWGKKRIMEVYLNVIEMGDGIFGIEMASQIYFNKPAKNLTRQEAAMIAACLPNPKRLKVKPLSNYIASRSKWVMQQMSFLEPDPDVQNIIRTEP